MSGRLLRLAVRRRRVVSTVERNERVVNCCLATVDCQLVKKTPFGRRCLCLRAEIWAADAVYRWGCLFRFDGKGSLPANGSNLVDPASCHMLILKIKPCMSKYELV